MWIDERAKKAINKFYEYKSTYENERKDKIEKIHKKYAGNDGEIQNQISKYKQQCIYCKRSVNTNFIKKKNKLIIMCGDIVTPCPDKLEIITPKFIHVNDGIAEYNKSLEELRQNIIKVRADLTYEFIDEEQAINEFQKLNDIFNKDSEFYTGLLLYKGNIEEDREREHMIISKMGELNKLKHVCSQILKKYAKTPTSQLLQDYIEIIKCKIFPQKQQLQNLTYSFQEITTRDIDTGEERAGTIEYTLHQRPNLFELYQYIWGDDVDSNVLQNGKKPEVVKQVMVEDSEESTRNQNNEEDNGENDEETKWENDEEDSGKNADNEDLEEVTIGEGNIVSQNEVIELRPKTNEYETDSDEDDEDED